MFQCKSIVNELENQQQSRLNQKIKEEKENFENFCGEVNKNDEWYDKNVGEFSAVSRFFGTSNQTLATCSSNYQPTPTWKNGVWSVDESKHYQNFTNNVLL